MHVLVVEDDPTIAEPLVQGLERAGFTVALASNGSEALRLTEAGAREQVEMVLLDLGLPDIDGTEVCRRIRARSDVPVIVVSARSDEIDRVLLLEIGADDYIVKPFGLRELVARMRAVARRLERGRAPADVLKVGRLHIDTRTRRVTVGDASVELTPKEFDLLALLASEPGTVFTRARILETVWDPHWYGPTKTLDVHVAAIRRKLGDPAWITTVRGVGYCLQDPADQP
ncbi:MAG TPA: response regulator transcription factor [Acidimicrobiales bacterium]